MATADCSFSLSSSQSSGGDHLLLLPDRVLSMDHLQLREDLAALELNLDFGKIRRGTRNSRIPVDATNNRLCVFSAGQGTVWLCERSPQMKENLPASTKQFNQRRTDSARQSGVSPNRTPTSALSASSKSNSPAVAGNLVNSKDGEDRIKMINEMQSQERQRKLEELQQHAIAAQRFREQQEKERRKRMEELRERESSRRAQVEERKRAIMEAEQDRREALLRRNNEREASTDAKQRNERSNIVFAFGSSTPRLLEPRDINTSFWGSRKATSTTNVMAMSAMSNPTQQPTLTRRSSERELDNAGCKKRPTSVHSLERKPEDLRMSSSVYEVLNWAYSPSQSATSSTVTSPQNEGHEQQSTRTSSDSNYDSLSPEKEYPKGTFTAHRDFNTHTGSRATLSQQQSHAFPNADDQNAFTVGSRPSRAKCTEYDPIGIGSNRDWFIPAVSGPYARSRGDLYDSVSGSWAASRSCGRRRTDLTPVIHSTRDAPPVKPVSNQPFTKAPGVSSPTRPPGTLNHQGTVTGTGSSAVVNYRRHAPVARKPRPVSVAGDELMSRSISKLTTAPAPAASGEERRSRKTEKLRVVPARPVRARSADPSQDASTPNQTGQKEIAAPCSGSTTKQSHPVKRVHSATKPTKTEVKKVSEKSAISNKSSPRASAKTTPLQSPSVENVTLPTSSPIAKSRSVVPSAGKKAETSDPKKNGDEKQEKEPAALIASVPGDAVSSELVAPPPEPLAVVKDEVPVEIRKEQDEVLVEIKKEPVDDYSGLENDHDSRHPELSAVVKLENVPELAMDVAIKTEPIDPVDDLEQTSGSQDDLGSSKPKISTKEQATAAIAEKRRLAKEAAEREAEMERQRIEEEKRIEDERQRAEEEEQARLAEEARLQEERRVQIALEELKKKEEEERRRREEEQAIRSEREEAERKAREEAEKLRLEMEERLKKEEEERLERKKRVEAIMSRTRKLGGGTPGGGATTPTSAGGDKGELDERDLNAQSTAPSNGANSAVENTSSVKPSTPVKSPVGPLFTIESNDVQNGHNHHDTTHTDKISDDTEPSSETSGATSVSASPMQTSPDSNGTAATEMERCESGGLVISDTFGDTTSASGVLLPPENKNQVSENAFPAASVSADVFGLGIELGNGGPAQLETNRNRPASVESAVQNKNSASFSTVNFDPFGDDVWINNQMNQSNITASKITNFDVFGSVAGDASDQLIKDGSHEIISDKMNANNVNISSSNLNTTNGIGGSFNENGTDNLLGDSMDSDFIIRDGNVTRDSKLGQMDLLL